MSNPTKRWQDPYRDDWEKMQDLTRLAAIVLATAALLPASGQAQHAHRSHYAGQETRAIKSLSDLDVAELRRGGGWGMAKSAELNGVPGPAHLLELKDQIPLSTSQVAAISGLHARMRATAVTLGEKLIALEVKLDRRFRERTIDDQILRTLLAKIAEVRRDLRHAHLTAHLRTPEILSSEQITRYNTLRGYRQDRRRNGGGKHGHNSQRKHDGHDKKN